MREILFRGKRVDNGEWVDGGYKHEKVGEDLTGVFIIEYLTNGVCLHNRVYPETVGQYTGLTDKNGTKIFEGDIILFDYAGKGKGVNGVESVVFKNGRFGVKWGYDKHLVCLDGFGNTTFEVIGNIHDNPELLKGGVKND